MLHKKDQKMGLRIVKNIEKDCGPDFSNSTNIGKPIFSQLS